MNKYQILTVMVFCALNASSKENTVRFRGHITNPIDGSVSFSYSLPVAKYDPVKRTAKVIDGDFDVTIPVPDGYTNIFWTNGSQQTWLYVQPGADLKIAVDASDFDASLHYNGKGSEIGNFVAKSIVEGHSYRDVNMNAQKCAVSDIDKYRSGLKDLLKTEAEYIDKNGEGLPSSFKKHLKKIEEYQVYYTMHMYPRQMEMAAKAKGESADNANKGYNVIFDIPEAFNDEYLRMGAYQSYLTNYMPMKIKAESLRDNIEYAEGAMTDSSYSRMYREMPPLTAEYAIGSQLYYSVAYTDIETVERRFREYKSYFPKSKNLRYISDAIRTKKTLGPGKPLIDFDITTPEGKHTKLSDLKGKVVYIDFWSRHCMPCMAEMPEAKKIKEHFKGKAVAFVYVSFDDEDTWKKTIKEYGIEGIHTCREGGTNSAIAKAYNVYGIPAYFLIDKDGKFADVQVVKRPSEKEELIAQITQLLE